MSPCDSRPLFFGVFLLPNQVVHKIDFSFVLASADKKGKNLEIENVNNSIDY